MEDPHPGEPREPEEELLAELAANLRLTPAERIRNLVAMNRLHAAIQARSLTAAQREALAALEIEDMRRRVAPGDTLE